MKKIISLIAIVAIIFTFSAVYSFAEQNTDFSICIDYINAISSPCLIQSDFMQYYLNVPSEFSGTLALAGEEFEVTDETAKYIFFEGWYGYDEKYVDDTASIGFSVDCGEITWTSEPDPNLNGATGRAYNLRSYCNVPIYKGDHTIEVWAKVTDEAEPVEVFDFCYTAAFGDEAPATPTPKPTAEPTATPDVTEAPATEAPATDAPATDAPATDAPATDAPATDAPATDAPADKKSGCAGVVSCGIAVVLAAAAGFILTKKKN